MTVKFEPWDSRERVAQMLEAPVRVMYGGEEFPGKRAIEAREDMRAILAELDRRDRVRAAQQKLQADFDAWKRSIIATDVQIKPITDAGNFNCRITKRGYASFNHTPRTHKAKVTLNGVPYCLTHLKRAEEQVRYTALSLRREEYVEDPAARAIVDEHEAETARRAKEYRR